MPWLQFLKNWGGACPFLYLASLKAHFHSVHFKHWRACESQLFHITERKQLELSQDHIGDCQPFCVPNIKATSPNALILTFLDLVQT